MQIKLNNYNYNLSEISHEELSYYRAINKQILDTITTTYDHVQNQVENEEIHTLKFPKARHKFLFLFLTKVLRRKPTDWEPWENIATNHKYKFINGILNILVKKNVNKDTYILFHTTARTILQLQNLGLTKSQALTSQVIESVGQYNLIVETRRIDAKIITHKTKLKQAIVADVQHHARLLQPIERLICDYHNKTTAEYKQDVVNKLNDYTQQLLTEANVINQLIESYTNKGVFTENEKTFIENDLCLSLDKLLNFLAHDKDYLLKRLHFINTLIKATNTFGIDHLNTPQTSKAISDELQFFLRSNLNNLVDTAQASNDQITHNAKDVLLRGKLRDCLMNTDKLIASYVYDQIHPITYEHQSNYCTNYKGDRTATNDPTYGLNNLTYHSSEHGGHSKKDLEKILIGITALEDKEKGLDQTGIKEVKSAAWNNFSIYSKNQKLRRFAAWICTSVVHLPLSIANLCVAAISGHAPIANLMQKIENYITRKFAIKENFTHDFFKLREKLGVNNVYTSTSIGKMLNKVVRELTAVVFEAPQIIAEKAVEQFKLFGQDFKTGLWGFLVKKYRNQPDNDKQEPENDGEIFDKKTEARLCQLYEDGKKLNQLHYVNVDEVAYAIPKNNLDPYNPHDILSSVMSGLEGFMNFFKNDLFEKHPVTALLASLAYAFGGSAVLSPVMLKIILTKIGLSANQINLLIESCHQIGKATAKGQFNEAIASGFTIAKITGVTANTVTQGFDSALVAIIDEVRKDPLVFAAGIGLAYGFGDLLTDVINIPGVTDNLREEIGTVPALAKIMIGAKIGLISLESALPEEKEEKSILAHFIGDVANLGLIITRAAFSVITISPWPWIDLGNQVFRGTVIVGHFINRLAVLTGQMLAQIPKTLLEAGSTLLVNSLKFLNFFTLPFRSTQEQSVIGVAPVLHVKNDVLQSGYQLSSVIRENTSRKAERWYGRVIKEMDADHEKHYESNSHAMIISNLNDFQKQTQSSKQEITVDTLEVVDNKPRKKYKTNSILVRKPKSPSSTIREDFSTDFFENNYLKY